MRKRKIRYNDAEWYGGIDLVVNYSLHDGVLTVLHEGSFIHHNPAKDAEENDWDDYMVPFKWSRYESPFVDLDFHTAIIEPGFKEIKADFFTGCKNLKKVVIPETIEKIHSDFARGVRLEFHNYDGLLFLGNDINPRHFLMGCSEDFKQEHLVIPEGVKFIFNGAFENKDFIHSVSFPHSLSKIWNYAFRNTGITDLVIPDYGVGEEEDAVSWYHGFYKGCPLRNISVPHNHYIFYAEHKDFEHVDWWHAFANCTIIFRNIDGAPIEILPPDPKPQFNPDRGIEIHFESSNFKKEEEDEESQCESSDDSLPF